MAVDLGEAGDVPVRVHAAVPAFADWIDFAGSGSEAAGEFRCADCGYGAVVQRVLPPCPMCRGSVWERRESRLAG